MSGLLNFTKIIRLKTIPLFILIGLGALCLIFLLYIIRLLFLRSRNGSSRLFSVALHNENNGDFEEAILNYEIALAEVKKTNSDKDLEVKIREKIKVLHTVIQYQQHMFNPGKQS